MCSSDLKVRQESNRRSRPSVCIRGVLPANSATSGVTVVARSEISVVILDRLAAELAVGFWNEGNFRTVAPHVDGLS